MTDLASDLRDSHRLGWPKRALIQLDSKALKNG